MRDLLTALVFEKDTGNWLDEITSVTKEYDKKRHTLTKLTPIEEFLKDNEAYVHQNLSDKAKKKETKYNIGDLVGTADNFIF